MKRIFSVACGVGALVALTAHDASAFPATMRAEAPRGASSLVDEQEPRGPRAGAPVRGGRRAGPPPPPAGAPNAEAVFERYVRGQARAALQLTPEEMRVVEPRLRQLQATRRRLLRERQRHLNELAVATRGGAPADAAVVRERLEAFETFKVRADQELQTAQDALDQVLTVEQRARFRVFERRMERQRLELMARARREAQTPAPQGAEGP